MCVCVAPQAFTQRIRRARIDHQCCECERRIKVGERYRYSSGVWDGRGMSYKTCLRCVSVRRWFIAAWMTRFDCEPCFGALYQDAFDAGVGRNVPDITFAAAEAGYV